MKVFVDPGHGGSDSGAVGTNAYLEKDFVMEWAQLLEIALHREEHEVMWSRTEDVNVRERDSAQRANEWGADYYIALHANGFHQEQDPDNVGMEVLYWSQSVRGLKLADDIRHEFVARFAALLFDRGSKPVYEGGRGETVLRRTNMPAVILEPGFITDVDDEQWLARFSTQALLADAVVAALQAQQ